MSSFTSSSNTIRSQSNHSARYFLPGLMLLAALLFMSPARAYADCNSPNPWFQPTTVERGDRVLVTGTGINPGQFFIFSFVHQTSFPTFQIRYLTKTANSNCVVNQEYVDTYNFKKGDYTVIAQVYGPGGQPGQSFFLGTLTVTGRSTPMPVYPPSNCGQTAHAWFGPTTVNVNQNMFIAAVARPGTTVAFFFDSTSVPSSGPRVLTLAPAHSNCVADDFQFRTGQFLGQGTYNVYAGFWDENGRYNYVSLGTLTVT